MRDSTPVAPVEAVHSQCAGVTIYATRPRFLTAGNSKVSILFRGPDRRNRIGERGVGDVYDLFGQIILGVSRTSSVPASQKIMVTAG